MKTDGRLGIIACRIFEDELSLILQDEEAEVFIVDDEHAQGLLRKLRRP